MHGETSTFLVHLPLLGTACMASPWLPSCASRTTYTNRAAEHISISLDRRKEPIIAIGGGVCLDVAGLAANLYRRNTPLIKVPTTVMAAVDASIGIKVRICCLACAACRPVP